MAEKHDRTDFAFTSKVFDGLIEALCKMADDGLPEEEWSLLLSVFAAAAGKLEVENETEGRFSGVMVDGGKIGNPTGKGIEVLRGQLQTARMPAYPPGMPPRDMVSPPKKGPRS